MSFTTLQQGLPHMRGQGLQVAHPLDPLCDLLAAPDVFSEFDSESRSERGVQPPFITQDEEGAVASKCWLKLMVSKLILVTHQEWFTS